VGRRWSRLGSDLWLVCNGPCIGVFGSFFFSAPDDRTILTGWLLQLAQTLASGCAPSGFHWVLHHPTTIVVPSPAGPLLSLMLTDGAELELSVDVTFHSSHHAGLLSTHTILAGPAHSLLLLRTLVGCLKPFLMSKRLVGRPGGGLPSAILVLLMQDFVLRSALASPQEALLSQSLGCVVLRIPAIRPLSGLAVDHRGHCCAAQ
jgi:hypothetical protein